MWQSLTVFLNSFLQDRTFEKPNRYKISLLVPIIGTTLGSELSRIFRRPFTAPVADKFSCFVEKCVPFGSLCKEDERKKIEILARQVEDSEQNVFFLKSKLLDTITVKMPADVQKRKLPNLKRNLQQNVDNINETIGGAPIADSLDSADNPYENLDTFEVYGLNEAIPRKLIAAYYTSEVVRDAYISDEGLHLLIEIPFYT